MLDPLAEIVLDSLLYGGKVPLLSVFNERGRRVSSTDAKAWIERNGASDGLEVEEALYVENRAYNGVVTRPIIDTRSTTKESP